MTAVTSPRGGEIACEDLVRIFSAEGVEVQALQGLTLHVEAGDLVAVVGASGSGKSTLLTILSGLDTPSAGRVSVAGTDLLTLRGKRRVDYQRHTVGFVWQQTSRNLLPYLTAAQNVAAVLAIAGKVKGAARGERAGELLDLLGVGYCADRRPGEMSGGEQQRVAIAVGIANEPRVLLADEPTGNLDEETRDEIMDLLEGLWRDRGLTLVIVTHDSAVAKRAQRRLRIKQGKVTEAA